MVDEVEMSDLYISTFLLEATFDAGTPVSDKYRITHHYPFTWKYNKVVVTLTSEC